MKFDMKFASYEPVKKDYCEVDNLKEYLISSLMGLVRHAFEGEPDMWNYETATAIVQNYSTKDIADKFAVLRDDLPPAVNEMWDRYYNSGDKVRNEVMICVRAELGRYFVPNPGIEYRIQSALPFVIAV